MTSNITDFCEIARLALTNSDIVLEHFIPNGKRQGDEYIVCNPKRHDKKPGSFKINKKTGRWSDFATNDRGGDLISLVAFLEDCSQPQAAKKLEVLLGLQVTPATRVTKPTKSHKHGGSKKPVFETRTDIQQGTRVTDDRNTWIPIIPIPSDAPGQPDKHPKHGEPTAVYCYRDEEGMSILKICRFETSARKQFAPLTYCQHTENGVESWRWQGIDGPRPLYNLNKISANPDSPIIITEGEKAADAAELLFPDFVSVTSMHGSQSAHKTDWSPLNHRRVVIWPDNDEPGKNYAQQVARLAAEAQAEVFILNIDKFKQKKLGAQSLESLPTGFDAADAVEAGITSQIIASLLQDSDFLKRFHEPVESNSGPFYVNEQGVFYRKPLDSVEVGQQVKKIRICSKLEILAAVRDDGGTHWGRLLRFEDLEGGEHKFCMPMKMLKGSGEEYREVLLEMGLHIEPGRTARELLTTYIQSAPVTSFSRCVSSLGWHGNSFVTTGGTIGPPSAEEVIFQGDTFIGAKLAQKGTVEDWKERVALKCRGNSRLYLALAVAFASPLVHVTNQENRIVHYRGESSIGKTTALNVAASVYGGKNYTQTWRHTDNALEGTAKAHNDIVLILDEIAQVAPDKIGEIVYMLGNGQGKGRANRTGLAREVATFRGTVLSSGELTLSDHMNTVGKRSTAGQEIRIIDVPANAGKGQGMFENIHAYDSPEKFARSLKDASFNYHGTVGRVFIERLVEDLESIPERFAEFRETFIQEYLPPSAGSQVQRTANDFALFAFAAELATEMGLSGWEPSEARQAVANCFIDYLEARGGEGSHERRVILDQIKLFFEQHGEARFTPWDRHNNEKQTINRAGFRREIDDGEDKVIEYFVLPQTFKSELCRGLDARLAVKVLLLEGWLIPGKDGKPQSVHRLPGMGKTKRCYHFSPMVLKG